MPKIGLLSDSHGRASTTRRAVQTLLDAGAQVLIHLGDVGSLEVIDELVLEPKDGKAVDVRLVFGNVDWDRASMGRYAQNIGLTVADPVGTLDIPPARGGMGKAASPPRRLVFLHGDDVVAMSDALATEPAYLCHGHSHRPRDERSGATRVINPGALFRAQSYTVALLDTDSDSLTFLPVEER